MSVVLSFLNIAVLIFGGSVIALMTPWVRSNAIEFVLIALACGMLGVGLRMFYTHPLLCKPLDRREER